MTRPPACSVLAPGRIAPEIRGAKTRAAGAGPALRSKHASVRPQPKDGSQHAPARSRAQPHPRLSLDPALIGGFYGGQTRLTDDLRTPTGKPPVTVSRAIRALGAQT